MSSSGIQINDFNNEFSDFRTLLTNTPTPQSNSGCGGSYSSIWQLTKIISIYGDTIKFEYTDKKHLNSSNNELIQWKLGEGSNRLVGFYNGSYGCDGCGASCGGPFLTAPSYMHNTINDVIKTSSSICQERSYLKSIRYNHNIISFYTSPRNDWTNAQKLDSISVNNSLMQRIKSLKFNYNYYQSIYAGRGFINNSNSENMLKRLRLDSLIIQKEEKYVFTYNSTPLPPKNSFGVDYWGFYNGQIYNRSPLPNAIDFNQFYYDKAKEDIINSSCGKLYAVADYCKAGVLEKIKYPTGGSSRFCYSLNFFDNTYVPNAPTTNNTSHYYGNGLKIDSIFNYTADGSISTIKYFQYESGKLQTPLHLFFNNHEEYLELGGQSGSSGTTDINRYQAQMFNTFSNNYYMPNPTGDGTGVGYDKVTNWVINGKTKMVENGKTSHIYTNNPDVICPFVDGEQQVSVPTYHKGFNNGTLLKEDIFDNSNKRITVTQFEYSLSYERPIEYNSRVTYKGRWDISAEDMHKSTQVSYYPLYKPETILTSIQRLDFFNTDSVVNLEAYIYNKNNLISNKRISVSNSVQNKEENYFYPTDIIGNAQYSMEQKGIMQTLITNNRINEIIKTENSIRTNGTLTSKTKYIEYDPITNLPKTMKYSLGSNVYNTDFSFKYDTKNNIIEKIDKDNVSTAYLWSYNYQYPIAEIKNATYAQVSAALGVDPVTIAASSTPDMSKVDGLRTNSNLEGGLVTTYTYKPLVGITSKTDPRGVTTRYLYDSFGRLGLIKDNNLNISGQYRYAYQNVPETNISSGTNVPVSGTIIKNDNTYLNTNTSATLSVTVGSGNLGYSWFLKDGAGTVLQSAMNSGSTLFNFISTVVGTITLQCDVIDYLTNSTTTFTKPITSTYAPVSGVISTNMEEFSSFTTHSGSATIAITGGSPSIYCSWSLLNSNDEILQSYTGSTEFTFTCTEIGTLTIKCLVVDNNLNTNTSFTKTIISK